MVRDVAGVVQERQVDEFVEMVEAAFRSRAYQDERVTLLKNQIQQFTHGLVAAPASSSDPAMATGRGE